MERPCLSANRIFRDLSPDEMRRVTSATVRNIVPSGRVLYTPGETGEVLFLLCKGSVQLYRLSPEGRKFIVQTVDPMTFFGEMAILGQNMQDLFAETVEDCIICVMSRRDVEKLIHWKPQVAIRMLEEIGHRMHDVVEHLGNCSLKRMPARVASLLLELSHEGTQGIKGMTHDDLADRIGTYRETMTNILDRLRDQGIIEIGRMKISIRDLRKLRSMAEEEVLRDRVARK